MSTDYPEIYRRRFIPNEYLHLKGDRVLKYEPGKLLLTRWKTLNPKPEFASGVSAYFLDRGIKLSRFLHEDGSLSYWYCDIIDVIEEPGRLTYEDLLFDVAIMPDGELRVLDVGEAAEAFEKGLITEEQLLRGMKILDKVLYDIYSGAFEENKRIVEDAEIM